MISVGGVIVTVSGVVVTVSGVEKRLVRAIFNHFLSGVCMVL